MKHRAAAFILLLFLLLSIASGCEKKEESPAPSPEATSVPAALTATPLPSPTETPEIALPGFHTLRLSTETKPRCWNVHSWVSASDAFLWSMTTSPLMDIGLESGENGEAEDTWLFTLAESVEDITSSWEGAAAWGIGPEETGRVWRIRLVPDACWDDEAHTPINADSYLDSMRLLLSPDRANYRAEAFCSGTMELSGAGAYLRSGTNTWVENAFEGGITFPLSEWSVGTDGFCRTPEGNLLCIPLRSPLNVWLDGNSLEDYYRAGYVPEEIYSALEDLADPEGFVPLNSHSLQLLYSFTGSDAWGRESWEDLAYYTAYRKSWPVTSWESVGLLKEDEFTLLYICANSVDEFDFLFGLTTPWLVYPPLYEGGSFEYDGKLFTDYGTSPETSISCGPYRIVSLDETQAVLERNESWFGYGRIGEELYETDRIVLSFLDRAEALTQFRQGKLDVLEDADASPSDAILLSKDDAYVYRYFMVTDRNTLFTLQEQASDGNKRVNKTCLANDAFRDALSYSIDRVRLAAAGDDSCRPALGLIGDLYRCNVAGDLSSRYRSSVPGTYALCASYGVNLSGIKDSTELRLAAERCTGFDAAKARRLFQTAADQMIAAGEWDEGMVVELCCAVGGESLSEGQKRQNALMQEFLDTATAGTDFQGKCSIAFVCVPDRYAAVAAGEIEMGYGAWGGAPFDPFGLIQCYCDPSFNTIQEGKGFDPSSKLLTLLFQEELVTRSYTEWCRSILEGGEYAADPELRLQVLAGLEEALLKERRFIVVAQGMTPLWLSNKLEPGSRSYSILSSFGGIRSLRYTQDDAQWAASHGA